MTEPECPFCGAERNGLTLDLLGCGSIFHPPDSWNGWNGEIWKDGWNRTSMCYEAELAKWKGLVKEAVSVAEHAKGMACHCHVPEYGCWDGTHKSYCIVFKAQAFLDNPEIKALMEGKEGG